MIELMRLFPNSMLQWNFRISELLLLILILFSTFTLGFAEKTNYSTSKKITENKVIRYDTTSIDLNRGWLARKASSVHADGTQITSPGYPTSEWMKAIVPGTVLTTLVENGIYPDPYYGLNNLHIPDIKEQGTDFYTYWFYKTFNLQSPQPGQKVWINFRGINYSAEIFLNGKRVNDDTHRGMFLRESYNITDLVRADTVNQLAVLVMPPDPPGTANGGQAGDGMIARNVTMQFSAGWDWVMPIRDRDTGIWDKVTVETTGPVRLCYPHVETFVHGKRTPGASQDDAYIKVSGVVRNTTDQRQSGIFSYDAAGVTGNRKVQLKPGEQKKIVFPKKAIKNPKLWWPNGYGNQPLYDLKMHFKLENGTESDQQEVRFGIREITSKMDPDNGGRIFRVNGQKIFIRGGNWIASDAMLQLSKQRYYDEVKMHAEMNLNMIRVWGGALSERPEFYEACDERGILVMQDLWITGDGNGAWKDPKKKQSKPRREFYPDNHSLFLQSTRDQIRMLRNHPSLCFWTGGNEWPPPADILYSLQNNIFPVLDSTRLFISNSLSDSLSHRGDQRGDGPYGIQVPKDFFTYRSYPLNPEVGSVGFPEAETMKKMMDPEDLEPPYPSVQHKKANEVWRYHKYIGYVDRKGVDHIGIYGNPQNIDEFSNYAQLANYVQYRSLFEGWNSHMWDWYTGVLLWKMQNPWPGLRGQSYDWFLDQNGGFYGLKKASEPVHVQYNLANHQVEVVNHQFHDLSDFMIDATVYGLDGKAYTAGSTSGSVDSHSVKDFFMVDVPDAVGEVYFIDLQLINPDGKVVSDNFYWEHRKGSDYKALHKLRKIKVRTSAQLKSKGDKYQIIVNIQNPRRRNPVAFWLKLQLRDESTGKRILPTFYEDNYFSLLPGQHRKIKIEFDKGVLAKENKPQLWLKGWNVDRTQIKLK